MCPTVHLILSEYFAESCDFLIFAAVLRISLAMYWPVVAFTIFSVLSAAWLSAPKA